MVTGRSRHLADGGFKRLRRIVDVVNVVDVARTGGPGRPRGAATHFHGLVLLRLNLRNGDDDHHRRCG